MSNGYQNDTHRLMILEKRVQTLSNEFDRITGQMDEFTTRMNETLTALMTGNINALRSLQSQIDDLREKLGGSSTNNGYDVSNTKTTTGHEVPGTGNEVPGTGKELQDGIRKINSRTNCSLCSLSCPDNQCKLAGSSMSITNYLLEAVDKHFGNNGNDEQELDFIAGFISPSWRYRHDEKFGDFGYGVKARIRYEDLQNEDSNE